VGGFGQVNERRRYYALRGFCYTPGPESLVIKLGTRGRGARARRVSEREPLELGACAFRTW